jgi:predicted nucleotidyltransferase
MPDISSMPVSVTYLDGGAAIQRLDELARALIDSRSDVQTVYLFGSLAQGRHVPGSDADLLIVLTEDHRRFVDRVPEFLRAFLDAPLAVDVFPYTVQELADKQQEGNLFVRQALEEGILLGAC